MLESGVQAAIRELEQEHKKLRNAIGTLKRILATGAGGHTTGRRRRLSAVARKRISEAARKRWANFRVSQKAKTARKQPMAKQAALVKRNTKAGTKLSKAAA